MKIPCRPSLFRSLRIAMFLACCTASTALAESVTAAEAGSRNEVHRCNAGPWGNIEYFYFYLEAPDSVVSQFPMPSTVSRWVFDATTFESIPVKLADAGISRGSLDRLLASRRMVRDSRNVYLFPTVSDLEGMSAETRGKVYHELAKHPANEFHASPIYFLTDTVAEWAEDSGLPSRIVQKLEQLSYKSGDALVFADIPLLISIANSDSEARLILRKLTRMRTLMARLEISGSESVPGLSDYWSLGLGLRRKEIEPLINAIAMTEGVSHLDILHLLPPLPRKLLYTYPDVSHAAMGRLPDCHWTSLNFFNFQPQNYFLDAALATSAVLENFKKVPPPYRYGDILMFVNQEGLAVHSATYLADDIVYSKNGLTMMAPWVLMRLPDLHKLYSVSTGQTRVECFRHNRASP